MSEEHENGGQTKGFSVEDKRRFSTDGEAREDAPDRPEQAAPDPGAVGGGALPEIDFSTFVLSLFSSAMVHLGDTPRPDDTTHQDLQLAKQTIDILGLLKDKTVGNLSSEEDKLLSDLLYDLRLRYVNAAPQ